MGCDAYDITSLVIVYKVGTNSHSKTYSGKDYYQLEKNPVWFLFDNLDSDKSDYEEEYDRRMIINENKVILYQNGSFKSEKIKNKYMYIIEKEKYVLDDVEEIYKKSWRETRQ